MPLRSVLSLSAVLATLPTPEPPRDLEGWIASAVYVLAAVWLVMQIYNSTRGTRGDWVTREELKLGMDVVTAGSIGRAKVNTDLILGLRSESEKRDDDRVKRLTSLHDDLADLAKTVGKGFEDMQRSLGRLEGHNTQEDRRRS